MKLIIISKEDFFEDEANWINALLATDCGIMLHLRKPNPREEEMEHLIRGIDRTLYSRLVLHDHLHLAQKYNLGGVHLNSRNDKLYNNADVNDYYWKTCRISRSCHSLEEVVMYKQRCCYVTLSPIFNSISKQGYCAAFTCEELKRAKELKIIDEKVVALGGIGLENIVQIKELGFGGAAVLGPIWKSRTLDEACTKLKLLVNECK